MTLRKLVSGDTSTLLALFLCAWLVSAFYRIDWWREALDVDVGTRTAGVVAFVCVAAIAVWASMLRRRFLWADPAELTWRDFAPRHDRARAVSDRVWFGWLARLAGLSYVGAFLGVVWQVPSWAWQVMASVVGAGGLLAWAIAAGVGVPWRLPAAARAGRARLVEGWREHVVRAVGVTFLDPGLLFPPASPVRLRLRSVRSFVVASVVGRARFAPAAVAGAVIAALVRPVIPAVPDAVVVGVCAFVALVPFGGGAAWLWRSPGLRRWLDESDVVLRAWTLAALLVVAAGWAVVLLLVVTATGGGHSSVTDVLPLLPVVAAGVVRTATRPPVEYATPGATDTPFGQAPVHLVAQLVRGPDLVVLGGVLIAVLPAPAAVIVAAASTGWALLR
ncbi:hypothetical protein LY13_003875 [Prauserella aidingensis]|uniref:DUF6297 family protein n=1 Tax=Prauserella aidingensis TaxID=387890 RepID=UPI0020A36A9E|nr:DUF6297 family protein [Prauserella aidingensis]MCP2255101.1 hypothetical protein [Prauserella aidingensis]